MNLKYMIQRHEGLRLKPYKDSVGVLTIGYGHNLEKGISKHIADKILDEDILEAEASLTEILPEWKKYGVGRQYALIDMMFNLGQTRFSGFKRLLAHIKSMNWDMAAAEMLDSKWAKQVGSRAEELAEMMRDG